MRDAAGSQGTTVQQLVNDARLGPLHWRVLVLCALVLMLDGYDLSAMGFALPAITQDFGIPPAEFGFALSASLIGVAIGSLVAGPIGDRYGRRKAILASFVLGGVAALGTTTADAITEFELWRFATGLGMGGVIPNAVALVSEYMPSRRRSFLVVVAFSSAAFGSFAGSMMAARLLPSFGWETVFLVGGIGPLLIAGISFFRLPESMHFLTGSGRMTEAAALARQLAPDWTGADSALLVPASATTQVSVSRLFAGARRNATFLIWLLFIGTQALVYFMVSWLATMLTQTGVALDRALVALSLFHLGALLGGLLLAWQSDRRSPERMLAGAYLGAGVAVGLLALGGTKGDLLYPLCFVSGCTIVGASFCLGALTSSYYPPSIRSMGIGWGLAIGRAGSIASPLLGGLALGAGWSIGSILGVVTVPAIMCAIAVLVLLGIRAQVFREYDTH